MECDKSDLGKPDQPTSSEDDDGSWILKLIDLSGLEKWSEHDKNATIEMIKRNANIFSKNDLDMGRTNLVKHHMILYHLRSHTGEFLHKCMMKSRHISKKC